MRPAASRDLAGPTPSAAPDETAGRVPLGANGLARALIAVAAPLGPVQYGLAGFLAGLWTGTLRYDAADPAWPDRDRFVLSDGASSPLLYALLHLAGFEGMEHEVLARAGRLHNAAARQPLPALHPAIEAAAGLPGQGLAAAVGMALAERSLAARFGRSLVDHRTWVVAGRAELAAGLGHEAALLAGRLRLDRLAVAFQDDGEADEIERRFAAKGWSVRSLDATDPAAVASCLAAIARARFRPILVACRDGGRLAPPAHPAPNPDAVAAWREAGAAGQTARRAWLRRRVRHRRRDEFDGATAALLPAAERAASLARIRAVLAGAPRTSALAAATAALDDLSRETGGLVFLSSGAAADAFAAHPPLGTPDYAGRHLDCDARAHAMTTLANGLASHGGAIPVCAAPAIASDRIRAALRLAALTGRRLIQLLIGDGLGASADGAAFQTVEQLASMRAMPGLHVFRPACAAEAVACLDLALARSDGPSVLMLDPDAFAPRDEPLPATASAARSCRHGGYLRRDPGCARPRDATLIASGVELAPVTEAAELLARDDDLSVAVVSLPCWELFARQPASYRADVLGTAPRFGIEAACDFGWSRWLGEDGRFIGLDGFGTAGEPAELRAHFGLTAPQIAARIRETCTA